MVHRNMAALVIIDKLREQTMSLVTAGQLLSLELDITET